MSKHHQIDRIDMVSGDQTDEWPESVKTAFLELVRQADENDFRIVCAVGLNPDPEQLRLSAFFSPRSSQNPHLADMCDDLAEMFQRMARRLRQ